jgi:hypothetical protein
LIFAVGPTIEFGNFEGNVATPEKSREILMRNLLTDGANFDTLEQQAENSRL